MINRLRYFSLDIWHMTPVVPLAGLVVLCLWRFAWARVPHLRLQSRSMPWVFSAYVTFSGYMWWYYHRPKPTTESRELFPGVQYTRKVVQNPQPLVIHLVDIDLRTPGLEFLVTPGDDSQGREVRARRTNEFLRNFRMHVAINGGFFSPWMANDPVYYYPSSGNPVDVPGFAVSNGQRYSEAEMNYFSLAIDTNNFAHIGIPTNDVHNLISGSAIFLVNGVPADPMDPANGADAFHPRTAVALNEARDCLLWIVVDGRQPNYSEGATLFELAAIAARHGGDVGLNLDGGGSSALVMADEDREPVFMNFPDPRPDTTGSRTPRGKSPRIENQQGRLISDGVPSEPQKSLKKSTLDQRAGMRHT